MFPGMFGAWNHKLLPDKVTLKDPNGVFSNIFEGREYPSESSCNLNTVASYTPNSSAPYNTLEK